MHAIQDMFRSHARAGYEAVDMALSNCLTLGQECGVVCTLCADACLGEPQVDMLRTCIRLNMDCADICDTTVRLLARFVGRDLDVIDDQITVMMTACQACAAECERHAEQHEHCRVCAETCRRCSDVCDQLLAVRPSTLAT
jgi:hypothetical protein